MNHATGYASQHISCLSQARIKWEVAAGRVSGVKVGDDGGGLLISPDGLAASRMVGVSASVYLPLHHKVQKILLAPAHLAGPRNTHTTILWSFCGTAWVSRCQKESSFGLYGWQTHRPSGQVPLHPGQSATHLHHPPFLRWMPFLSLPSLSCLGTGTKYAGLHTEWWVVREKGPHNGCVFVIRNTWMLQFSCQNIWQGSVATHLRYGWISYHFTTNLLMSSQVKEFVNPLRFDSNRHGFDVCFLGGYSIFENWKLYHSNNFI